MRTEMDRELAKVMAELGPWERQQVLKYARSLQHRDGVPGESLLKFCGTISKEDAQLMREAIEEDFERV